uniref:Uncharacterized protein n=1 Tax=Knipowitschia caucasica TaxID=637954 RepID=A0AAV2KPK8_KNICA
MQSPHPAACGRAKVGLHIRATVSNNNNNSSCVSERGHGARRVSIYMFVGLYAGLGLGLGWRSPLTALAPRYLQLLALSLRLRLMRRSLNRIVQEFFSLYPTSC